MKVLTTSFIAVGDHHVSVDHYINGERVGSPETFELFSPIDQRVLGRIAQGTPEQVASAVTAASDAFPAWSQLTAAVRRDYLHVFAAEIGKRRDAFCEVESNDAGVLLSRMQHGVAPRAMLNLTSSMTHPVFAPSSRRGMRR